MAAPLRRPFFLAGVGLFSAGTLVGAAAAHGFLGVAGEGRFLIVVLAGMTVVFGAVLMARFDAGSWLDVLSLPLRLVGAALLAWWAVAALSPHAAGLPLSPLDALLVYAAGEALRLAAMFLRLLERA